MRSGAECTHQLSSKQTGFVRGDPQLPASITFSMKEYKDSQMALNSWGEIDKSRRAMRMPNVQAFVAQRMYGLFCSICTLFWCALHCMVDIACIGAEDYLSCFHIKPFRTYLYIVLKKLCHVWFYLHVRVLCLNSSIFVLDFTLFCCWNVNFM